MKRFLAVLISFSMVLCFAACGNEDEKEKEENDVTLSGESNDEKNVSDSSADTGSDIGSDTTDSGTTDADLSESEESTSDSSYNPSVSAGNDFDILRGNNFYMSGSMTDETGAAYPAEMAITPDATYMLATNEGITLGMLLHKDYMCMILGEQKAYLKIPASMMETIGMTAADMGMDELNFSDLPELSEASAVTEEAYEGHNCQVYHFEAEDGTKTLVYLDGEKLISLVDVDVDGEIISTWYVDVITTDIPEEKTAPPADYKCYEGLPGMMEFMTEFEDVIGGM